jgi:hypothetical protein
MPEFTKIFNTSIEIPDSRFFTAQVTSSYVCIYLMSAMQRAFRKIDVAVARLAMQRAF